MSLVGGVPASWRPLAVQEGAGANRFVAPGTATGGEFGLFDCVLRPGNGTVPHFHEGFSESFHLISGELRIRVEDRTETARPGDFVYVPKRGVHVFRNDTDIDVHLLMLFVPGAPRESYFRAMAEAFADGRQPSAQDIDEIARAHDQVNLRDPRWALAREDENE